MTVVSWLLAALLLVVGVAHLVAPAKVEPLVPEWWPARRATVYASGVAEVVIGIGLLVPATRTWAAGVAVLMFLAYTHVHFEGRRLTSGVVNLGYAALALFVCLG
ncbi:MauE/DoxX family redox-associated membrane protein [Nocardioides sp. NPDC047086]|uniref:MauE/DoxX family redox-associated membrane protein n=1 Tax=Nocardioides sp. NPDC047086 TaxID=3154810 RepID=UPI0033FFF0A6